MLRARQCQRLWRLAAGTLQHPLLPRPLATPPAHLVCSTRRELCTSTFEGLRAWDAGKQSISAFQPVQQLVVTASGPDRPGIVARLSKRVLDCGGNVELSRMARLAGEFSILMLITFNVTTARKAEQLRNSLLQIEGLQVSTRWTSDDLVKEKHAFQKFRKIMLRGVDNPGLVYNVAEYLSSLGINIESLETYTREESSGGPTLFMMEGVIAMPVSISTSKLIHNLGTLQATLGVEIVISNLPDPAHYDATTISPCPESVM